MSWKLKNCRYVKLPEQHSFRLLRITNNIPPVEISMEIFRLRTPPKYTALSYTWGHPVDEDYPETVMHKVHQPLPGQGRPGKLSVTLNLHDALLQLQRMSDSSPSEYFWIDAICIDQGSLEERDHQVNMMCEIYETLHGY
jgi:Heterokaryon incompatibility protein (HET)